MFVESVKGPFELADPSPDELEHYEQGSKWYNEAMEDF